jgi:hypothetical protein
MLGIPLEGRSRLKLLYVLYFREESVNMQTDQSTGENKKQRAFRLPPLNDEDTVSLQKSFRNHN